MNIYFSENMKCLRKERDLTQDALANFLGVSFQAVSKWERGESYPDIEMLPEIAGYFGVSVDELLGINRAENKKEIRSIIEEYDNLTDAEKKHGIILKAIKMFPNDFRIQLRYMGDLAFRNNGTDYKENLPKIKAIYSNIQKNCRIDTIRICSKRYLAAYYNTLSYCENSGITYKDCEQIINEMPYMRDGQEFLRSYLYPHDTDIWRGYTMEAVEEEISLLCHGITHLFYVPDENNKTEELIHAVQTEIHLLNLFYDDGNYGRGWRNMIFSYGYLGYLYAKKGDYEKGVQYLKQEAELAKQFDALDRITIMHSSFFEGRTFDKHTLGSTFVASSRVKHLIEEKYPLPDAFKAIPEFRDIIEMLK